MLLAGVVKLPYAQWDDLENTCGKREPITKYQIGYPVFLYLFTFLPAAAYALRLTITGTRHLISSTLTAVGFPLKLNKSTTLFCQLVTIVKAARIISVGLT